MTDPTPSLTPEQAERIVAIAGDLAREGKIGELSEFLDHGLPVDTADGDGNTLLMLAAYHGQAATVEALLARGADANARNARDQAPVAGALFKGEDDVVRLLVRVGADLDAGTPSGRAAAQMFGKSALLESLTD
jgi:ankyrin repeat protein